MAGRFITFEGGEGSGKSTQARLLAERLRNRGESVVLTREPGGTLGAEAVRSLLVTGDPDRWSPWAEACLVNAARADHVDRIIRPALAWGDWVICDRFVDSTRAYQGAGKGLDDNALCRLHDNVTGDLWPDFTVILDIDVDEGLRRAAARRDGEDRFESHAKEFHNRIAAFFSALPDSAPDRCRRFDARRPVDDLASAIAAWIAP
jgi:dTMP kinase